MTSPYDLSGVHVALTTPFDPVTGKVDHDALMAHTDWLIQQGIDGVVPNGSLGEYESLDRDERRAVVETVAGVASDRAKLIVGVSGPNWRVASDHAEHAAELGATAVMLLPPTNHLPTREELKDHYTSVAQCDLPIIVYNNPFSTRIDLTPEIIADLAEIEGVSAVKEFSGDVRRLSAIHELAPLLQLLCGADDLALESALMGATGWIGGFTGALPVETKRLFELGMAGDLEKALPLYRSLLPLFRWDSGPRFVEAIKYTLDLLKLRGGGPPRPPRRVLEGEDQMLVQRQLELARTADRS